MQTPNLRRIAAWLALLPLACWSAPALRTEAPTDRLIVKWRATSPDRDIEPERVNRLATRLSRTLHRGRTIGGGMSVVMLDRAVAGTELAATLAALRADPDVELAEPDRRVKIQAYTPNDPVFTAGQWYLKNTEASAIGATDAWELTRGAATVVVAVLDTGVRPDHEDLAGKLLPGYDFVSGSAATQFAVANDGDSWDADPSDPGDFIATEDLTKPAFENGECGGGVNHDQPVNSSWHGTRVAGMVAANTDNGVGMSGSGFNVRILPVRVLGKCGGFESDVLAGMYWAAGALIPPPLLKTTNMTVNPNPAHIINMSLGSEGACSDTYATAVRDVTARGVLIVASAGNEGAAVGTPASCEGVLAVAGLRQAGTKVGYSNLGPEVDIAAPAGNCVLTGPGDPCLFALETSTNAGSTVPGTNTYSSRTFQPTYGTSFSSPLAAGTAGLMKAVNPALTPAMLIARIRESARAFPTTSDNIPAPAACQLPTVAPLQDRECLCTTQVCGAGMLSAVGAVNAALRPAVMAQVVGTVGAGRTVTLDGTGSSVAVGRSAASTVWSVVSTSGGAAAPIIQSANQLQASVLSPSQGNVVLRLTLTDNLGSSDFAEVTLIGTGSGNGGGSSTTSPPPDTSNSSGGGGTLAPIALLWLVIMTLAVMPRRRRCL